MAKNMYQKREERKSKKMNDDGKSFSNVSINWYPGHMAKTKREIKERINLIDIIYEVIDARIPISSKIPDLDELISNKPKIIIVTKYDLCDKIITDKILKNYEEKYTVMKVDLKSNDSAIVKRILDNTNKILNNINDKRTEKGLKKRIFRALVVGAPNVGKSTLINRLVGRNATLTGNKAGVTKSLSWIKINKDIELLDSPGILWPKIDSATIGYNLASFSSINENIINKDEISSYIIKILYNKYPNILYKLYGIEVIDEDDLTSAFDQIAHKRGALLKGNNVDYDKVYNIIINDLKSGKIKNITFDW